MKLLFNGMNWGTNGTAHEKLILKNLLFLLRLFLYTWELLTIIGIQLGWTSLGVTIWSYLILFPLYIVLSIHSLPFSSIWCTMGEWAWGGLGGKKPWSAGEFAHWFSGHEIHAWAPIWKRQHSGRKVERQLAFLVWKMKTIIQAYFSYASEYFCCICWTPIAFHYHLTTGISHGSISLRLTGGAVNRTFCCWFFFSLGTRRWFPFIWIASHTCSQD